MGKDPDAIRREIARTREGMAETVDALAYKGDVKSRTKDKVRTIANKPKDAVLSIKDNVMGTVHERTPDRATIHDAQHAISQAPGQVVGQARRAGGMMRENPVGLAIGGLAAGFVAGLLLPNTRMENEKLGPISDQIKDSARDTGQELLDRGKEVAQSAADAAQEAVKQDGPDAAKDVASSAMDKASDVRETAGVGVASGSGTSIRSNGSGVGY